MKFKLTKSFFPLFLSIIILAITGCQSNKNISEQIQKVLKDDPKIFIKFIEDHPVEVLDAFQNAVKAAQLIKKFENTLAPKLDSSVAFRGNKNAPIQIVEYSDFECFYCKEGYKTVTALRKIYGDKMVFVYKHLPLESIHPKAMISAQYFEAINKQDSKKAYLFHDELFLNQKKIGLGEKYLDEVASKLGVDMAKLKKDINSDEIKNKIKADVNEALSFGIKGTPGFVVNGVLLKGAQKPPAFTEVLEELKKRGKLKF